MSRPIPARPNLERDRKTAKARQFLSKGNKVKVTVFFRYRQLRRPELGQEILDRVANELEDVGTVEFRTRGMEGRSMNMVLAPKEQHA